MARSIAALRIRLALGTALLATAPALAQPASTPPASGTSEIITADLRSPDAPSGNEIVVVARRRAEKLIDVPIAVSAYTADQLAKEQAIDLSGIQGTAPNVNLVQGRGSTSNANIFIRGIGQPDALQTFDPAVGVYVDGVYISRIQGALFNLFDVDHIEVLRGPQGTLYGKNTIGGAVNVISKKPDLDAFHASGNFTYGSYNQKLANAYVTIPLVTDKLALSLAGVYDRRDGTVEDPLTGRHYNDRNTQAGRAILRYKASDKVELTLEGDYTRQHTRPTLGYATAPLTNLDLLTGAQQVISPANPYGSYDFKASTSLQPGQDQTLHHYGATFTANIELNDAFTLTSISAYRKLKPNYWLDFDATQLQLADAYVGVRQRQISQEVQLKYDHGPLKGVAGLYYLNEHISSNQLSLDDDYITVLGTPATFQRYITDFQTTKSYAAFGQLTYDFTDKLSATAGIRYTDERKHYVRSTYTVLGNPLLGGTITSAPFDFPGSLPAPYNELDHVDFHAWTPSFTLSYKPTRDTLLYASASRGFKSGGFNGRVNGLGDVTQVIDGQTVIVPYFKPETVWTYEAGAKGSFLGGRVSLSGDVFYSDYKDFQARVGGGTTGIAGGSFPVINAGKLRIWGIETELAIKPTRAWSIRADVGYLNAKYLRFDDARRAPAFSCNPTGAHITCKPAFAPPLSASIGSDYAFDLNGAGTITVGGDARFVDKQWLSVDNRPGLYENGYWLFNAYVRYDAPSGHWYVQGGVKNAANTVYKTDAQEFSSVGNIQTVYYGDPRTWTGTVGFRF
ncbi:TonB-dependent receptor [Nostoc sp. 3335mG]|nr:TonB-dependent receptor [Nostoc sp. 3335mG]